MLKKKTKKNHADKKVNNSCQNANEKNLIVDFIQTKKLQWYGPVSYTHLDVYKRQQHSCARIVL